MGLCQSRDKEDPQEIDTAAITTRSTASQQELLDVEAPPESPRKIRTESEEAILSAVHMNKNLSSHGSLEEIPEGMLSTDVLPRSATERFMEKEEMRKVLRIFESQSQTFEGLPMLDFEATCYCWEELDLQWSKSLATRVFNDLDTEKNSHISFVEFLASVHAIDPTFNVYWRPLLKLDPDDAKEFLPFPQADMEELVVDLPEAVEMAFNSDLNHAIRAQAITALSDYMFRERGESFVREFTPYLDTVVRLVHTPEISLKWYSCFQIAIMAFTHADHFLEFALTISNSLLEVVASGHILAAQAAQNCLRVFAAQIYDPQDKMLSVFVDGTVADRPRKMRKACIKCITDILDRPDTARRRPDDPFWKRIEEALGGVVSDESNLAAVTAKAVHRIGKHNEAAASSLKGRASAVIQNEIEVLAAKKLQFDLDVKDEPDDEVGIVRREVKDVVHQYDADDSGVLEVNEIEQVFRDMKHTAPELDTIIVRRELDVDHRGQIVIGDFIDMYIAKWGPHGSRRTSKVGDELPRAVTFHHGSMSMANDRIQKVMFAATDERIQHTHNRSGSVAARMHKVQSGPLTLEAINRMSRVERRHRAQRRSMMMQRKHITTLLMALANDGQVSLTDLERMWSALTTEDGVTGRGRTISGVRRALDPANSGSVSVEAFSQWWYHDQVQTKKVQSKFQEELQNIEEHQIRAAFNKVDQDQDGLIGLQDFCLALEDLKIRWSLDDAKKIFKSLDEKKTKNIDYEEFRAGLFELHTDQMEVFWRRLLGHEVVGEDAPEELEQKQITEEDRLSLDEFFEISGDRISDWRRRVKGLNDFSVYLCDPNITTEEFREVMEKFKDHLLVQIQERRSQVARVACQNLGKIVAYHKEHFREFTQFFMVALYYVVRQTSIKISCESAIRCCRAIVEHVPEDDAFTVLHAIAEGIGGEHSNVRKCCFQYMGQLLEVLPSQDELAVGETPASEEYLDEIEELLALGINDSDGKVRTAAFHALALLSLIDEDRSDRLAENLTSASRRKFDRALRNTGGGSKAGSTASSTSGRNRKGSNIKDMRARMLKQKESIRESSAELAEDSAEPQAVADGSS